MKSLASLCLIGALFCSCRPTAMVTLNILEPAPVTIPSHIKNIAIVNRSLTAGANKVADAVDKVFTLEGPNLDKDGSKASIRGLTDELSKDKRFTDVKFLDSAGLSTVSPQLFPAPLTWDVVQKICDKSNSDALFVLEMFDTDAKIAYSATPTNVNTPLGKITALYQRATMTTLVKTGWRIYDPVKMNILDEFTLSRSIRYTGSGINPVQAANAIIGRKQAVMEVGNRAGQAYAYRVVPFWLTVGRNYFVKGNYNFKIARRKVQTGNWNDAGDVWLPLTKSNKRKTAGRACYNMAIVSEMNGDINHAIQWAQKSFEDYNIRYALNYVRILENRKRNNNLLDFQESEAVSGNYQK